MVDTILMGCDAIVILSPKLSVTSRGYWVVSVAVAHPVIEKEITMKKISEYIIFFKLSFPYCIL
jgi:hypothetical protein